MTQFSQTIEEIRGYFRNNDIHLGYRRLLDAAIETNNYSVYRQTLNFCDWYDNESNREDSSALQNKVGELLSTIAEGYKEPVVKAESVPLKATGISKKYSKGFFSLSMLDLSLHRSQIIGLVGENGNGKTTLLRVLIGELQNDTGEIEYSLSGLKDNKDLYEIRSKIAFIPQRPNAWYGSLMDNLQFASSCIGLKGEENRLWTEMIIARMGLRPFRTFNWGQISSGYKMRFELARTLIRRPQILLLDEPLANLDMLAQQIILEDLRFLSRSQSMPLSIILSSQQLYEVEKVSDQVIFLKQGKAKYQYSEQEQTEEQRLVLELEIDLNREELEALLRSAGLDRLSYNGGVYLLYFSAGTELGNVLQSLSPRASGLKYIRDISSSSRRFFDA